MTNSWRHLPPPARPIAAATVASLSSFRSSTDAFEAHDLAAQDPAQTGLILGTVVRLLLEDANPDGLTADDVRAALASCVRSWPEADPQVVLWLLAGALGVLDEEGAPAPKPAVLARHAVALVDDLLAGRPVEPWLTAALAEIERSQLND
ncbi:hypothetical protein [Actinoplanes sp. NPDC023714]|uniref:hypothetical protein n=1 Tax=Actinoplanes sp. NPDC023714 TaxID=3154322 RepID=UPI0033FFCC71